MTVAEVAELRDVCVEAARRGGAILRERWGMQRTIELKGGIDLVTDADRASEAAVLGFLRSRLPGAAILAEESGASGAGAGDLRFFVDPLDGTTNYAHGVPHFAVNVAVADAGGLAAGATYDPLRDELFTAARGEGAFLGDARLRHSGRGDARRLAARDRLPVRHPRARTTSRCACSARSSGRRARCGASAPRRSISPTSRAGRFDGFWEQRLKPWDIAPGILLAREAGAIVTDLDGGDGMLETGDIVAAAPALHAPMLEVIRREWAG